MCFLRFEKGTFFTTREETPLKAKSENFKSLRCELLEDDDDEEEEDHHHLAVFFGRVSFFVARRLSFCFIS